MKLILTTLLGLMSCYMLNSQVGIGNTNPKATLDISASNTTTPTNEDGILIPRIDNFPTTNPGADQDGMMVFVTGNGTPAKGFYYWDNGSNTWVSIQTAVNSLVEGNDIDINANQIEIEPVLDNVHTINSPNPNFLFTVPNSNSKVNFSLAGNQFFNIGPRITENIGIGVNNGADNTDRGFYNIFIGYNSGQNTTSTTGNTAQGSFNQAIGGLALSSNTTGVSNVAIGFNALGDNVTGSSNIALGTEALSSSTASSNIAIGVAAGYNATTGGGNIFLGRSAGFNETGSNKLYIENSNANEFNALIYGEFDTNILRTNGEFQIGNPLGSGYAFPIIDGVNGQVMTTDGAGNVTFQDALSVTDTDDQTIDVLNLNGTNLEISLEDDGVATQTLDLSSLQDGDTRNTLDEAYDEGGAGAGRTINATDGALRVDGTDGLLITGTSGLGNTIDSDITGAGIRMFFNPNTASLRAGQINGSEWDHTNIGDQSVAFGFSTIASGLRSSAFGDRNIASGFHSAAFGSTTVASGSSATTFGVGTIASGMRSVAFGLNSTASGTNSLSVGDGNNASGDDAVALNYRTVASGARSVSIGSVSEATGSYSFSGGLGSIASGVGSTAIGIRAEAPSWGEFSIGIFPTTYTVPNNWTFEPNERVFSVGNGTNTSNRSNALTIYKSGLMNINDAYNMPTADGTNGQVMTTDGAGNVTFQDAASVTDTDDQTIDVLNLNGTNLEISLEDDGVATQTLDLSSISGGILDQAYDFGGAGAGKNIDATDGAVRINGTDGFLVTGTLNSGNIINTEITGAGTRMFFNPRTASFRAGEVNGTQWDDANIGDHSVAIGENTTASGDNSMALGVGTTASGAWSSAFGGGTNASGDISTAFGSNTIASGDESTAFGYNTTASGRFSTALGFNTIANGYNSTALGNGTMASSFQSTAFGLNSTASGISSTAFGNDTEASGNISTAFGYNTIASASSSTAFGEDTEASGNTSTAFGYNTIASASWSTAFGEDTEASGSTSTAFGFNNVASGSRSTAFGFNNVASGSRSTAFGAYNTAPSFSETTIGVYATQYTANSESSFNFNDRLFSIGNGTNASNRSNALTIYKSGLMNINDAYNMPTADGTAGQVMTTDGAGNVTFQDAASVTDTDDQTIDVLNLNGTNLEISLEDDGEATQTLDLSSLQDGTGSDDQQIDTFNFDSNTNVLTLELEDDGQAPQTVNLSSLNPTKSVARILMSANQNFAAAGTNKVTFDFVDLDVNGDFNTTTNVFTVPEDGLYRVTAQITAAASTGTGTFVARVRVNGSQVRRVEFNHTGNGQVVRQVTSILNLTAGQTIDVAYTRPGVGVSILANGQGTFFEIEQL